MPSQFYRAWGLAVLACCSVASAHPVPPQKGAPLYVAERGASKVYILGGCGGEGHDWLSDDIRNALGQSREFWRELPIAKINRTSIAYSDKVGTLTRGTLFDLLDSAERARVLAAAQILGMSREKLAPMKIWYAARILTFASYAKTQRPVGQASDPELVLSDMAAKRGIPMHAESPSWRAFADFFDRMPPTVQTQYLAYNLDEIEQGGADAKAGDLACGMGDPSDIDRAATEFSRRYPALYAYLNGSRDAEWARKIDRFLRRGGVTFIVVGTNHTVGPRSIQRELARIGIEVHRV
jgi:uncharacterized protein YbaP (TraB family)